LVLEFNLETTKLPQPIIRAEDEFMLLKTLWSSPDMRFKHERIRVQLALIAQLAGVTGNRPGALLALQYQDLKVSLLRDPNGGLPKVLVDFTFKKTKSYHGSKEP
jgi:integrase